MTDTRSSNQRGRPRGFDEEQVLAAAMDLFWRKGYDRASLIELSAATKLSASSVYNAYGSKLELFLTVLDRYLDTVDAVMLGPLEHGTAGLADIEVYFARIADVAEHGGGRGCLAMNTIVEFRDAPAAVEERTQRYLRTLGRALTVAVERAARAGEIPAGNLRERVETLSAAVLAAYVLIASGNRTTEANDLLRAVMCLVRAGGDGRDAGTGAVPADNPSHAG
ncbi:TetR/AcrR family transcriptional regulator [Saccharothrix deserti]|uniref:TetR/AcrR family transcriptional regulator n=1 Tax=Saccharothrix deserti TaxID=2593674 RepID=UPI00131A8A83|nr:TetR/AcrR family transcriptional regulator [Saccharothrix deserti]